VYNTNTDSGLRGRITVGESTTIPGVHGAFPRVDLYLEVVT
jgi:hypothetical protein